MSTAADLRGIALGQPDVAEVETWGHPTFRVGGRIVVGLDEGAGTATVRATRETQASLVAERPDVFGVAPRVGRSGWITVVLAEVDVEELRELVTEAWHLAGPSTRAAPAPRST